MRELLWSYYNKGVNTLTTPRIVWSLFFSLLSLNFIDVFLRTQLCCVSTFDWLIDWVLIFSNRILGGTRGCGARFEYRSLLPYHRKSRHKTSWDVWCIIHILSSYLSFFFNYFFTHVANVQAPRTYFGICFISLLYIEIIGKSKWLM